MLPIHHFHGLVLALYGSLLAGNEIVMVPAFDARRALDAIRELDVTLVMGVPTMYRRILDAAESQDDLGGLRLAISGSAPLGAALWERFHDRFGTELIERYGLTETGIVTSNPIDAPRGGSVGRPLPGVRVAIRTEHGYLDTTAARAGERGEICVAGPNVMRGYGNDPEATTAALHDGYFHTGDLGHCDEDGYLWIDGRIKELIIVGGSNVVPGEVERALAGVQGVAELAVAGVPDDDLGEIVTAYVVAAGDGDADALERSLGAAAEAGLAPYKRPRRYVFVPELPRNAMGKIDRARLVG